jgi:serine/tyrosine/threonine adenylyltransferase
LWEYVTASVITSDTYVDRDIKYNGQITHERATIVSRIAPTFIRFGSFQIADINGPCQENPEIIKHLLNYVIRYHCDRVFDKYVTLENRVVTFAKELVIKTAHMVAL